MQPFRPPNLILRRSTKSYQYYQYNDNLICDLPYWYLEDNLNPSLLCFSKQHIYFEYENYHDLPNVYQIYIKFKTAKSSIRKLFNDSTRVTIVCYIQGSKSPSNNNSKFVMVNIQGLMHNNVDFPEIIYKQSL